MEAARVGTKHQPGLENEIVFKEQRASALLRRYVAPLLTGLVLAFCAFVYLKTNILRPIHGLTSQSDFSVYYRAAKDIVSGVSPYESPAYFYPPLIAFLMTPFALTDYVTARSTWFVLSHLFLLFTAWYLWRAWGRGRILLCSIACVWALGGALKETLDVGQISPLLVLALAVAYTRAKFQDLAVGIGFALKYIPGLLLVALFLHRRWRTLLAFSVIAILAVAIPWGVLVVAFTGATVPVSAHYWMGTPAMYSWSLPSVVLRALNPPTPGAALPHAWVYGNVAATLHLTPQMEWISVGTAILTLLAGISILAVVCRGRLSKQDLPWAMIGLISLSMAAAPVCWTHYQVLQYPGIALLLAQAIRLRRWKIAAAVLLCSALMYQLPHVELNRYVDVHSGAAGNSLFPLYLWTSSSPLACLALFGLALSNIRCTLRHLDP